MSSALRRATLTLAALSTWGLLASGCHDPIRDPYLPDPTPVPIDRPSPPPAGYFPTNLTTFQLTPDAKTAKSVLLDTLGAASGGFLMLEADQLTDPDVIAGLRRVAGAGASVMVTLDDGDDGNMTVNQAAYDGLRSSGVSVQTPRHPNGGSPLAFTRQRARTMFCMFANGTASLIVFSGPLTTTALTGSAPMPAAIDLSDDDIVAESGARGMMAPGSTAPHSANLADGPGPLRNGVDSWLSAAHSSLQLSISDVSDPAMIARLGGLDKAGVDVQMLLPAGASAQAAALTAAGVETVQLATTSEIPSLAIIDGKQAIVGLASLATAALDHDRQMAISLTDSGIVANVVAAFTLAWGPGS